MKYKIKNWSDFQHYKLRNPPWIRLYRTLLDDINYHELTPETAKYLTLLWLIAAENDGLLPDSKVIAFRLHIDSKVIARVIQELLKHFLEAVPEPSDSKVIATCKQSATTETDSSDSSDNSETYKDMSDLQSNRTTDYQDVIDHLNQLSGRNYGCTDKIKAMMKTIAKAGYSIDDMKKACYLQVLDCKGDPKLEPYMHPGTIFKNTTNFDRTLNKSETTVKNKETPTMPRYKREYLEKYNKEKQGE